MSREIKFRAWNVAAKVMYESNIPGLLIYFDGELNGLDANGMLEGTDNTRQHQLMQYTGLKDKNGKEIYEGDILKCKCWDKRKSSIDGFDPLGETPYFYRNSVIEWWHSHCNLGYRLRDGKGKTLMIKPSSLNAMEVEVIGNIYEHKHLLEETA